MMTSSAVQLLSDEHQLGRYTVDILRERNGIWQASMMQLDATVTNYRLLLRPFRRRYKSASLPQRYIADVVQTQKGTYYGATLRLSTQQCLHLTMCTGKLEHFVQDLQQMRQPSRRVKLPDDVQPDHVRRLIDFLNQNA